MSSVASHVLMIEPVHFRFNPETAASNAFQVQQPPGPEEAAELALRAPEQHRRYRDLLVEAGVWVTLCRSLESTPDAPFCNNWFSTHPGAGERPPMMVVYPLLSEIRRRERREDLIDLLRPRYARFLDLAPHEQEGRFLESTGSLCLDQAGGVAYAALSPRTDRILAASCADALGLDLLTFTAVDAGGTPYYHTNVMMFVGHGVAVVALESIVEADEQRRVRESLEAGGNHVIPITRAQVAAFCGNGLALRNDRAEPVLAISSAAYRAFTAGQRAELEARARLVHTELSAFERLAGGSARCLLAELF